MCFVVKFKIDNLLDIAKKNGIWDTEYSILLLLMELVYMSKIFLCCTKVGDRGSNGKRNITVDIIETGCANEVSIGYRKSAMTPSYSDIT